MSNVQPKLILREKWLSAMESGKYRQACRALRYRDAFCAIGLAFEIAGGDWTLPSNEIYCRVAKIYGLRSLSQIYVFSDCGFNFKQIAAKLRQYPDIYFE